MTDLKSLTLPEMTAFLQSLGEPAFRGRQVFTWLHRGVTDFDGMTNLSKSLREKLKETCFITAPQVARKQVSRLDGTIKYLWELSDGNCIETVLMQYHHGNTVCISSQVGCRQVFTWLHRGVTDFDGMTNLSKSLREKLKETCFITAPQVARKQVSRLDGTIKYLWELSDGNCIETVLMQYHHGNTVCISSQVGCRMGCAFCASTIAGKVRDLTPAEMLDQVLFTQKDSGLPVSNIVLMGIGEPLDNLDTVLKFLELVNHPDGMNIGMRHISLSTCGIVPGIRRLAELELQLTLSVSLHAPDSETRSKIMPINRAYDVEELFRACHDYFDKTGRRISFEYAMIDGVNDHDWQADLIARKLRGMPGHVNLIPLNDVVESPYKPSRRIGAFQKRLESHGITATVRRSLGGDIDASCGQLRRKAMEEAQKGECSQ